MKNFEKNLDRVIDALREINEILKETNLEMQKAMGETKSIKYAIYQPETDMYYNSNVRSFVFKLKNAKLYPTLTIAKQELEILKSEDPEIVNRVEIQVVQLKVVE